MTTPSHGPALHTFEEAAAILGINPSWLRRHSKRLPRVVLGRAVRFSDEDLERILAMHHHEPDDHAASQPQETSPSPLRLKPLPRRRARSA